MGKDIEKRLGVPSYGSTISLSFFILPVLDRTTIHSLGWRTIGKQFHLLSSMHGIKSIYCFTYTGLLEWSGAPHGTDTERQQRPALE